MSAEPKDPRSTGRKRGRAVLQKTHRPYFCGATSDGDVLPGYCGRTPNSSVVDPPGGCWPGLAGLQVDHINKNVLDNDPANLTWACPSCHKEVDSKTAVGVSRKDNEYGYATLDPFATENEAAAIEPETLSWEGLFDLPLPDDS
jgi:hypothetical protein